MTGNGGESERKVLKFERKRFGVAPTTLSEEEILNARRRQDLTGIPPIQALSRSDYREGPYCARTLLQEHQSSLEDRLEAECRRSLKALHPIQLAAVLQSRSKNDELGKDLLFDLILASMYFRNVNQLVDYVLAAAHPSLSARVTDEYVGRSDAALEIEFLEAARMQRISLTHKIRTATLASLLRAVRDKQPRLQP